MRIKTIVVRNFRALSDATMHFDDCTCLIGENNAGKSSFLKAIEAFFSTKQSIDFSEYHLNNVSEPAEITITFDQLTEGELIDLGTNLVENELIVTRKFIVSEGSSSGKYYIKALGFPPFKPLSEDKPKSELRSIYRELQASYPELPNVKSSDDIPSAVSEYEKNNFTKLKMIELGRLKGFTNVASAAIKKKTDFVFVPAIKDASELDRDAKSPIKNLLDSIAKQSIENKKDYREFMEKANKEIALLTSADNVPELREIGSAVSSILNRMYRDSTFVAHWQPIEQIPVKFPTAEISIESHSFLANLDKIGHGLQRAVILAVVQYLAQSSKSTESSGQYTSPQSDIILAIEEPEAFQHPSKQRIFSKVLRSLSDKFSAATGIRFQVIFATHSPIFLEIPSFDKVRLVRRNFELKDFPAVVGHSALNRCLERYNDVRAFCNKPPENEANFIVKLHTIDVELREVFFSRLVVLVEGSSDKAILTGYMQQQDRTPMEEEIVFGVVKGKSNLLKTYIILDELGVPTYSIFDNDSKYRGEGNDKEGNAILDNRILQYGFGVEEKSIEEWPAEIGCIFAALEGDIEKTLVASVGQGSFDVARERVANHLGVPSHYCTKNPTASSTLINELAVGTPDFSILEDLVAAVDGRFPLFPVHTELGAQPSQT